MTNRASLTVTLVNETSGDEIPLAPVSGILRWGHPETARIPTALDPRLYVQLHQEIARPVGA